MRTNLKCSASVATIDSQTYELDAINRNDFPILSVEAHPGKPVLYLDSAASSQKPIYVLDKMEEYYRTSHSNVHRGIVVSDEYFVQE